MGITEGLSWIRVLGYVRKRDNAGAVSLGLSEGPLFESTPPKREILQSAIHRSAHQARGACNIYFRYLLRMRESSERKEPESGDHWA
jgi:hypothetical protein